MKSFIFVSFAFLAWAFYELSDGADFQPRVAATAPLDASDVTASGGPDKPHAVEAATLVASPAITPVKAALVTEEPAPAAGQAPDPAAIETAEVVPAGEDVAGPNQPEISALADLGRIGATLGQGLSLYPDTDPAAQPMMLASLEQGTAGLIAVPPADPEPATPLVAAPPPADIREIRGTRVNMRDGPGTIYPVITSLTLGQEVEVLGESGTGWLRLRSLSDQTTGWIAASLVTKAAR